MKTKYPYIFLCAKKGLNMDDVGVSRDIVFQEIRPGAGFETGDFVKEKLRKGATVGRLGLYSRLHCHKGSTPLCAPSSFSTQNPCLCFVKGTSSVGFLPSPPDCWNTRYLFFLSGRSMSPA